MIWILIAVIAVAVVPVTATLSAAEAALGSLSRSDIEEIAEQQRRPGVARHIAADIGAHTTAISFTRIALETMAGVAVAIAVARTLDDDLLAFLIASGVMLVVGFVVTGSSPRSIGRAHPEATLRFTAWLVRGCRVVVGPIADLLVTIGDAVTPGRPARSGRLTSEEQLLSMVDEATELAVFDEDDRELIHSVVTFGDHYARELMVARTDMVSVDAESTVAEALEIMFNAGFSRVPVIGRDGDDVRGIAYQKDLSRYLLDEQGDRNTGVLEHLRPALIVPESLRADDLLQRMRRESVHFAIVIDEYGGVAGLVSMEDLIEEIVGDIDDEYDRGGDAAELVADGSLRVPSRMSTSELGELFDVDLEDDDVDSVGGLLGKELGKVPEPGDTVVTHGLELRAERSGRRRRVTTVLVRSVADPDADGDYGELPDSIECVLDEGYGTAEPRRRRYPRDNEHGG